MNDKAQGVLAVMDRDYAELALVRINSVSAIPSLYSVEADLDSREARATVAELIEAAEGVLKYASVKSRGRLRFAIARAKANENVNGVGA